MTARADSTKAALSHFAERVHTGEYEMSIHPKATKKLENVRRHRNRVPTCVVNGVEMSIDQAAELERKQAEQQKAWIYMETRFDGVEWLKPTYNNGPILKMSEAREILLSRFHKLKDKGWTITWDPLQKGHQGFSGVFRKWEIVCSIDEFNSEVQPVQEQPVAQLPTSSQDIPDGTYTVVRGEQRRTFKITTKTEGNFAGKRIIAYLSGPDNERDYTGFGFMQNRAVVLWKKYCNSEGSVLLSFASYLAGDWRKAGETYAVESGRCYRCGRKLTVPASVHRGLGPDCAEKIGL